MTNGEPYQALAENAVRLLRWLELPADTLLTWQTIGQLGATDGRPVDGQAVTFAATPADLAEQARRYCRDAEHPNLYVTTGLHDPPGERTQATCRRVLLVPLDCDACDWLAAERPETFTDAAAAKAYLHQLTDADLETELELHRAVIVETLADAGLPTPSLWWRSGYGHYALYALTADGADDIETARAVNRDLVAAVNGTRGYTLADKGVVDAGTRVLRPLGAWNVKNPERPRLCRTQPDWRGPTYALAELRTLVPESRRAPSPAAVPTAAPVAVDAGEGRLPDDVVAQYALDAIPADDYQLWIGVGKALHALGYPCETWAQWSSRSPKAAENKPDEYERRWHSFNGGEQPDKALGYLVNRAREHGSDLLLPGFRQRHGLPTAPPAPTANGARPPADEGTGEGTAQDLETAQDTARELVTRTRQAVEAGDSPAPLLRDVLTHADATTADALALLAARDRSFLAAYISELREVTPKDNKALVTELLKQASATAKEAREAAAPARVSGNPLASAPSDLRIAESFAEAYRRQWLPAEGRQWYRYDSGVWRPRATDELRSLLWPFVHERLPEGATKTRVDSILDAAVTLKGWYTPAERLNANPLLVNVTNGVYDLETGELRPHDPELLQTVQRPFPYDPDAVCERWKQFTRESLVTTEGEPDDALALLLQEWFGYCLVPHARAQKAMIWTGEGANGKGVATAILSALIGEENAVAIDIAKLDDDYKRATLRDKLLAVSSEVPSQALISDATFKAVVAGDRIPARLPYHPPFTFRPYARFLITCNSLPATRDQTFAFYRRLILMPWNARFEERPNADGKPADVHLEDKLRANELPGIFRWAVEGLARLVQNEWRFTPADAASRALETYRLEGDSVALWAAERLAPDPDATETTADLYADYKAYCENGSLRPVGVNHFPQRLRGAGWDLRRADTARRRQWRGARLTPEE